MQVLLPVLTRAFFSIVSLRRTPGKAGPTGRIPSGEWTYCSVACKASAHTSDLKHSASVYLSVTHTHTHTHTPLFVACALRIELFVLRANSCASPAYHSSDFAALLLVA